MLGMSVLYFQCPISLKKLKYEGSGNFFAFSFTATLKPLSNLSLHFGMQVRQTKGQPAQWSKTMALIQHKLYQFSPLQDTGHITTSKAHMLTLFKEQL